MNCTRCLAPVQTGAKYCENCGFPIPYPTSSELIGQPGICTQCGRSVSATDFFCGSCGTLVTRPADNSDTADVSSVLDKNTNTLASHPETITDVIQDLDAVHEVLTEDLEITRMVRRGRSLLKQKFLLSFSTGGSATVQGRGLLGRNPKPATEIEYDQLVIFRDPNRTVSKTHLEFWEKDGQFWIRDAGSANGSYIYNSDQDDDYTDLDISESYLVLPGVKVGVGDEYFIVDLID